MIKKYGKNRILQLMIPVMSVCLLMLVLTGCMESPEVGRSADIDVLFTGDVHCAVDENIGYVGLAEYKAKLLKEGSEVLLVDTGDAIQGAAIGSLSRGEDIIELMNRVGYDAMTLGNHEFDYGGPERVAELAQIADFQFLSVNFRISESGETPYKAYTIFEKDGVKIAFIGVSTPHTLTSSTPAYFQDENGAFIYDFMNDETGETLFKAVQAAVDAARAEGADYVIALTHLGIIADDAPFTSNDLIANTTGVDAVLDGHSHSVIDCAKVKNKDGSDVLLSSTGTRLENIGVLNISQDGSLSTYLVSQTQGVDELIREIKAEYEETLGLEVGALKNELIISDPVTGVRIVRSAETNLGDFCADAFRAASDADIAFVNGGGIRSDLKAGTLTYGNMLTVHPFGNLLCKALVSGQDILDALELSVSKTPEEKGGFLQVSGISFEIDMSVASTVTLDENGMFKAVSGARRVKNVEVGGEPIDASKEYSVVSIGYILKDGGNGYNMFSNGELIMDDFMLDIDALTAYMTGEYLNNIDLYSEPYGTGRIVAIN